MHKTPHRIYCDNLNALSLTSELRTSECHDGFHRRRCWCCWCAMMGMCCAHLAGQGLALIPEPLGRGAPVCWSLAPLLAPPHSWPPQHTQTPVTRKQACTQHQHINCMALYARLVYETFIFCTPSLIFLGICQYWVKSLDVQQRHTGLGTQIQTLWKDKKEMWPRPTGKHKETYPHTCRGRRDLFLWGNVE